MTALDFQRAIAQLLALAAGWKEVAPDEELRESTLYLLEQYDFMI